MATVAEQLRRAREAQNLDIYQVAEITKMKTDHIRALESGDYEGFAAPIYIRGFVRTYARVLKLDAVTVGAELEEELSGDSRFRDPPPLTNNPRGIIDFIMLQLSRLNWVVVVVALVLALLLLLGWKVVSSVRNPPPLDPLDKLQPGLYEPAGGGGATLPVPGTGQ